MWSLWILTTYLNFEDLGRLLLRPISEILGNLIALQKEQQLKTLKYKITKFLVDECLKVSDNYKHT